MPPASAVHRFCIIVQAILSVQMHLIFMPPSHFSTLNVQRGTITQFMLDIGDMDGDIGADIPAAPIMPGMVIPGRSIIMALDMRCSFLGGLGFP